MSKSKTILAWHWSDGLKCQYDSRPIVPGETLVYEGQEPIKLCKRGLHASTKILHTLGYAPGTTISRVRLSGEIIRGENKLVAIERTCLWSFDATYILITFAADCAERALLRERKEGREPDPRCFEAIEAARKFVKDPSEENREAARECHCTPGTAGYVAWAAWDNRGAANWAAFAASSAAHLVGEYQTAVYVKERKWQSARLRNLIAAGRRNQL